MENSKELIDDFEDEEEDDEDEDFSKYDDEKDQGE